MHFTSFWYIFVIIGVYSAPTNIFFDTLLDTIDCGCSRTSNLDVSKTQIHVHNFETNISRIYPVMKAADAILRMKDFDTRQCIQMFIPGIFNVEVSDTLCAFSKIKCNGRKTLGIIVNHRMYTDGSFIDQTINGVPFYMNAVRYTKSIGEQLGYFMTKLLEKVDRSRVEIIGFSLGTHMAGYMGDIVKKLSNATLKRIYAIEPAGPCYNYCKNEHVKSGQAEQVLAFHCNSGELGSKLNLSDYDFYSFNGKIQRICGKGTISFIGSFLQGLCSHEKCIPILLNPSIGNKPWKAVKCTSKEEYLTGKCNNNEQALAGYKTEPRGSPGVYFFNPKLTLKCNLPFNVLSRS